MSTAPVSGSSNSYSAEQTGAIVDGLDNSRASLSQEDFLELLSVQFQQQDPFNPTSDTEFMAQMAQFNALEQMSSLNREFAQFRASSDFATASGVIGKEVVALDGDGNYVTGTVESAIKTESGYQLVIDGAPYPLSAIQSVQEQATPSAES